MPLLTKPARKMNWTYTNGDFVNVTQEPNDAKKVAGWLVDERPPREYMNWLFWNTSEWVDYLESATDATFGSSYDAIIGGPNATHADINAAMADSNVPSGSRIFVAASAAITTTQVINKSDITVEFKPGVTYTKSSASKGIQVTGQRVEIERARMEGFSGVSDIGIEFAVGATFGIVTKCRFYQCTTQVNDLAANTVQQMNIVEG